MPKDDTRHLIECLFGLGVLTGEEFRQLNAVAQRIDSGRGDATEAEKAKINEIYRDRLNGKV